MSGVTLSPVSNTNSDKPRDFMLSKSLIKENSATLPLTIVHEKVSLTMLKNSFTSNSFQIFSPENYFLTCASESQSPFASTVNSFIDNVLALADMAAFARLANNLMKVGVGLAVGGAVVNSALYNGKIAYKS